MYLLMHLITGYIFLIIGFIKQTGGVDTVILCINTLVFAMSVINMLKNNNLEKTIRGKKTLFKNTKALGILREINERKVPEYADIKLSNTTINKLTGNGWQPVISGTFTALGVLGTFLGLSIGLGSLGMTTAEILDNIDKLIPGITTAFTTSIVGLGMSTSYNFWFRGQQLRLYYAIEEYKNKFNKFGGRIDAPETVEGLNSVLTNFCHQSKMIIEHMQEMTEKAEDRIEQALTIFENNVDNKLNAYENMLNSTNKIYIDGVNEAITKFRDETIEGVRSELSLYREDAERWVRIATEQQNNIEKNIVTLVNTGEQITSDIKNISSSILDTYTKLDTVNSELGNTVEKLVNNTQELKEAINKSDETIKEHLTGIANSMDRASDTCKETNKAIVTQVEALNTIAIKIDDTNTKLGEYTDEIHTSTSKFTEAIDKSASDFEDKLEKVSDDISDKFSETYKLAEKSIKNAIDSSSTAIKESLDVASQNFKENLDKNQSMLEESLEKAKEVFTVTLENTGKTVESNINTAKLYIETSVNESKKLIEESEDKVVDKIQRSNIYIEQQSIEMARNREIIANTLASLDNTVKYTLENYEKLIAKTDESMHKNIEDLGTRIREDIIKVTGDRIKDIASKSEDKISRDIQKVIEEEAKSAEIILKLLESTSNKLLEYAELMETINKATPNIKYSKEAAKMLNDDLEKIAVYMEKIKNIVEKLSDNDER